MTTTPTVAAAGPATAPDLAAALVTVTIDGREVEVPVGTSVLRAAELAGVRIPTLCHHPDLPEAGVCRVCVVEVSGQRALQASCAYPITGPVTVTTRSPRVRQARRDVVDLLLSEHAGDCQTCVRDGSCELQDLAVEHGVTSWRFGRRPDPARQRDLLGPSVVRDMGKCVHCLRCTRTCEHLQDVRALGVVGRGTEAAVSTFRGLPLAAVDCIACGQCIDRCPTGALHAHDVVDEVWDAIADPDRHVVIQTAPAPRAAIGEEFGMPPGTPLTWQLVTALREIGFDRVFDTSFAADLTIMEEGAELLTRLYRTLALGDDALPLPQFTSCCPGWVTFIEQGYPDLLGHMSTCKSPQQMFGALLKTWYADRHGVDPANLVSVSLMPCTAKKAESGRAEMADSGHRDVDLVLTTRELATMIRQHGIHLPDLPPGEVDDPFGTATGSGVIFGATGGVMEAALRTVIEVVSGEPVEDLYAHADVVPVRGFEGVRLVEVTLPDRVGPVPPMLAHLLPDLEWARGATLRLAVVHGTHHAARVLADIRAGGELASCHFIEFMACPGGCLGGGGQPIPTSAEIRAARARAIYAEDTAYGESGRARKSHRNEAVARLYRELLPDGPGSHDSHRLLHTHYAPRARVRDQEATR